MSHSYQRSFERNVVSDTKRRTFRVTKHAPSGRKSVPHFCKDVLWIIYTAKTFSGSFTLMYKGTHSVNSCSSISLVEGYSYMHSFTVPLKHNQVRKKCQRFLSIFPVSTCKKDSKMVFGQIPALSVLEILHYCPYINLSAASRPYLQSYAV